MPRCQDGVDQWKGRRRRAVEADDRDCRHQGHGDCSDSGEADVLVALSDDGPVTENGSAGHRDGKCRQENLPWDPVHHAAERGDDHHQHVDRKTGVDGGDGNFSGSADQIGATGPGRGCVDRVSCRSAAFVFPQLPHTSRTPNECRASERCNVDRHLLGCSHVRPHNFSPAFDGGRSSPARSGPAPRRGRGTDHGGRGVPRSR